MLFFFFQIVVRFQCQCTGLDVNVAKNLKAEHFKHLENFRLEQIYIYIYIYVHNDLNFRAGVVPFHIFFFQTPTSKFRKVLQVESLKNIDASHVTILTAVRTFNIVFRCI